MAGLREAVRAPKAAAEDPDYDTAYWKMCGSKRQYDTEFAANFFGSAYFQRAYRCDVCGRWHLSSQMNNRRVA